MFGQAVHRAELERVEAATLLARQLINDMADRNLAVASVLAATPAIRNAIARGDRAVLLDALQPAFEVARARFGIDNIHIHTPGSVTILRLHKPEQFGDDLTALRRMIVAVNASHQPRKGLELGVNGLPVRGATPVVGGNGEPLGVLEVGSFITDAALERLAQSEVGYAVFHATPDGRLQRIAASARSPALSQADLQAGMAGMLGSFPVPPSPDVARTTFNMVTVVPLQDWAGTPVGALQVAVDVGPTTDALRQAVKLFAAATLGLLTLAGLVALTEGRRTTRALTTIDEALRCLAGGGAPHLPPAVTLRTDEIGDLARAVEAFRDGMRREALLSRELNHRSKNMLATVQALATQTLRVADGDGQRFAKDFLGRLQALAHVHDLLTAHTWSAVSLDVAVRAALASWLTEGVHASRADTQANQRIQVQGSGTATLAPIQLQAIVLGLHELVTNAVKHGALARPGGTVAVRYAAAGDGQVTLDWIETGGPPFASSPRRGFGLRLLERVLPQDLGLGSDAAVEFRSSGLRARFRFSATVPARQ